MKQAPFGLLFSVVAIASTAFVAHAQNPSDEQTFLSLVKEVQAQRVQINENQQKIDSTFTALDEVFRQARILSKRAGGTHQVPKTRPPAKPPK